MLPISAVRGRLAQVSRRLIVAEDSQLCRSLANGFWRVNLPTPAKTPHHVNQTRSLHKRALADRTDRAFCRFCCRGWDVRVDPSVLPRNRRWLTVRFRSSENALLQVDASPRISPDAPGAQFWQFIMAKCDRRGRTSLGTLI